MGKLINFILYHFNLITSKIYFSVIGAINSNGEIVTHKVLIGKGFVLNVSGKKFIVKLNKVIFNNWCSIKIRKSGQLLIGEGTFFNDGCSISCMGKIEIGNNVLFGENVKLYDHNHKFKDKTILIAKQDYSIGEIKIGNNCWFGSNVVILRNVTIGDNVIVGAGCIIFKSIESNTVIKVKQELISESF